MMMHAPLIAGLQRRPRAVTTRRSAWSLAALAVLGATAAHGQWQYFEAESGTRANVSISTNGSGYTGTGFVTGFTSDASTLTISPNVPDGLYEVWVRYRANNGYKGYGIQVGAEKGDGSFNSSNSFTTDRAGVFNLTGADKSVKISKGWGYYDVDRFELRPATILPPLPVAPTLVDEQATPRTQFLMNYLTSVYGSKTLSGQQGQVGSSGPFPSSTYLSRSGGVVPAVRGSDFIEYSPSRIAHGSNPNGETERIRDWAKQTGGVVTMMWHWNAPTDLIDTPGKEWWRGFYTDATTFDVQAALAAPGSPKYNLLVSDIDAIAVQLKKFSDADVPVIWRPLHEAQGNPGSPGWFWWGAKGPEPFKQLWNLMYDRMTNVHGLHNLIWEYTSTAAAGDFADWYPGDDVVDIIGHDAYTDRTSSLSGQWYDLLEQYNGEKLLALSESGTLPDPAMLDERGVSWSYFSPWQADGSGLGVTANYTAAQLQAVLNHDDVITLNELPWMPWSTVGPTAADGNFDGDNDVDGADWLVLQRQLGGPGSADANGDGVVDALDEAAWKLNFGAVLGALATASQSAVPEPGTATLVALSAMAFVAFQRRAPSRRQTKNAMRLTAQWRVVTLSLAAVAAATPCAATNPAVYEVGADPDVGFNLISWFNFGGSGASTWQNAVQSVYDAGFREVSLSPVRYVDLSTGAIATTSTKGPELSHVAAGLARAKSLGMRVTVNPFVEPVNFSTWRGFYNPTPNTAPWTTFWGDYEHYLVEVAQMAQANGADAMTVGTELNGLDGNAGNNAKWSQTINAVNDVFQGELGYAANWDHAAHPNVEAAIWEHPAIDFIGIDAYFTNLVTPVQADASGTFPNPVFIGQMEAAWDLIFDAGADYAAQRKGGAGMPAVLTEVGYLPYNRTGVTPQNSNGTIDVAEQTMAFNGMINAADGRKENLRAIHIWQWGMPGSDGSLWNMDPTPPANQPNNVVTAQWLSGYVNTAVPAFAADLNVDGQVDGEDLAIWANGYGETLAGDVDADGDSDGSDFLLWQQQVGGGVPLGGATPTPEPAAASLALMALITLGHGRRRVK